MKQKIATRLIYIFLLGLALQGQAQKLADTIWASGMKNEVVHFGMATAEGIPIVYSDKGNIMGINPDDGSIIWKTYIGNFRPTFKYFTGTPYIDVDGYVLSPISGQIIPLGNHAVTEDNRPIHVFKTYVFPKQHIVLIYGEVQQRILASTNESVFTAIDFVTGKVLWTKNDLFRTEATASTPKKSAFGGLMKEISKEATNNILQEHSDATNPGEKFLADPIVTKTGTVVLPLNDGLHAISLKDGSLIWKKEYAVKKKGVITVKTGNTETALALNKDSSTIYIGKADFTEAIDASTGNTIWPDPKTTGGSAGYLCNTKKGMLSLPSPNNVTLLQNNKISLFDPATGEIKWELKLKAGVVSYLISGDTVFLGLINGSQKQSINALTLSDGKMLYAENIKIDGSLLNLVSIPAGLLIMSSQQIMTIKTSNGSNLGEILKKSEEAQWLTSFNNGNLYVLASGNTDLYTLNNANGNFNKINTNIKFEDGETPNSLESFNNNILLSSNQNLLVLNGTTYQPIYQKYYKAPAKSFIGKAYSTLKAWNALNYSFAMVRADNGMGMQTTGLANYDQAMSAVQLDPFESNASYHAKEIMPTYYQEISINSMLSSINAIKNIRIRYGATKKKQANIFMLSILSDNNPAIIQVSKSTGEIVSTVKLLPNDKNPDYLIDEFGGKLFYIPKVTNLDKTMHTINAQTNLSQILCLDLTTNSSK